MSIDRQPVANPDIGSYSWAVLDTAEVELNLVDGQGVRLDDYQFKVILPFGTGFQFAGSSNAGCDWDWTETEHPIEDNGSPAQYHNKVPSTIYLVRCEIGDGNSELRVQAQVKTRKISPPVKERLSILVKPAWHRDGAAIRHQICLDPGDSYNATRFAATVEEGGLIWMKEELGIDIAKSSISGCAHNSSDSKRLVSIRTASDTEIRDECLNVNALGCAFGTGSGSAYPHLGSHEILIRSVLAGATSMWVSRTKDLGNRHAFYLQSVVAHEFGHTAGLGHFPKDYDALMADGYGHNLLREHDKEAMMAIYEEHRSHE